MNFSLKPNTIISHFLPGAFFLLAVAGMLLLGNSVWIHEVCTLSGPLVALLGGVGFPAALIIGLIFDAFRNLILETIFDWHEEMPWDIFAVGDKDFLENITDRYYGFYVFDVNFMTAIIATIVGLLVIKFCLNAQIAPQIVVAAILVLVVVLVLLFFDAMELRTNITRLAKERMPRKLEGENAEQNAP